MRKTAFLGVMMLAVVTLSAQTAPELQVKVLTLSNGMTVWLNEDHTQPKIYGGVVVRAGGKDCPDTGIAHYFEHIMFKGTDRIGTVDYEAERPWLDSISVQYDLLSQTSSLQQRAAIQQHINGLSLRAADYAIPNEFSRLTAKFGGTGLNAGTSADMTVYYNTFLPQYITQWCWLNSERLIHPVFRGFQAELENVYEEKNRAADGMRTAYDAALRAVFKNQPYAWPVLGSTENLKNPRLSDMEAFYKKYYVAPNMCLILTGDLPSESLIPLLEQTFGRVQTGSVPERTPSPIPPFQKGEEARIKVPIPIVKAEALVFRAPTVFEPDADALVLANRLLSDEKAGLLDSLTNEHSVMIAGAMHLTMDDAGVTALYVVPKIPFGKMKKAEGLVLAQLEKVMEGRFSDGQLELQKRSLLQEMEQGIETIEGRAEMMVSVFSQGHTWQEYLDRIERVRAITKADVVAAARKYYGDEHLTLRKKYGTEKKETLLQPGYVPVQPKNAKAQSDFARWLEALPTDSRPIRTVDFERDVVKRKIEGGGAQKTTLYYNQNPVNDIFTFTLRYYNGSRATPLLEHLDNYLAAIGTDSLRKQQLESAWQQLGVTMNVEAGAERFTFTLTGRDEQLLPALRLLNHFLTRAKGDKEALKALKQEAKVTDKAFGKQKDDVLSPMLTYTAYGEQSDYLRQPSLKEVQALTCDSLLALFRELQQYECDLVYTGRQPVEYVAMISQQTLPLAQCRKPKAELHRQLRAPSVAGAPSMAGAPSTPGPVSVSGGFPAGATVYFYHVPKSRQNFVCSYELLPAAPTASSRASARLWARYMGGGMSSVLFQNIREFRSLAYSTQGQLLEPNYARHADDPLAFITITGTQADKTLQVMDAVDSLLRNPLSLEEGAKGGSENLDAARQELLSRIQNNFPSFRTIGYYVANQLMHGYTADPSRELVEQLPKTTASDIGRFWQEQVSPNRRVWLIIGDRKLTDFQALARYGKVVELHKEDIYR
ncbi:MAG: insulinase family protein [Prevotella sp.]|nr:insulinase family protein [Prevotella sp.]